MPIYEDESHTREDLLELRRRNRCQVCHGPLDVFLDHDQGKAFLACRDWLRTKHEGIERLAEPPPALNIATRREDMVERLGEEKATKLEKYQEKVWLSRQEAMDILRTCWPGAPDTEVTKAAILCQQYGLNPLMKHVFLIPFQKKGGGEDWVVVLGISASRSIARQAGDYTYLDGTPRIMTEKEQLKTFGKVDPSRIWAITKVRDSKGNEAPGYGFWPQDEKPYGADKGNTALNMAFIRSERNALDRLFAGRLPQEVEVMEERYLELPSKSGGGGEKGEPGKGGEAGAAVSPPTETGEGFSIDPTWLNEALKALKWSEVTAKSFLVNRYKVDGRGTLAEVLQRLTREQAEDFVEDLNSRLEKQPKKLF